MSPLSVADVLPLDNSIFDVVIFDEASQIPVEDALPTLVRAPQVIVVGDDKQLPPTDFFSTARSADDFDDEEDFDFELGQDSLLRLAAAKMSGAMLGWHYRSRSEELIGFSNAAFYDERLLTVPSVRKVRAMPAIAIGDAFAAEPDAADLLARPVSFHHLAAGIYSERRNQHEAAYIARALRALLVAGTGRTIGVVAFSEAQQGEIESAIDQLAATDSAFAALLAAERERETDGEFVGLLVKNLENIQGDERDIVILSICYGQDAAGRMLMNFGPINKAGGEKRLNVIFSRARENMIVVSSIRPDQITNDYNLGANTLKCFLSYAEAMSEGNEAVARLALSKIAIGSGARSSGADASVDQFSRRLGAELGCEVRTGLGLSSFRIDLALHRPDGPAYDLAVLHRPLQRLCGRRGRRNADQPRQAARILWLERGHRPAEGHLAAPRTGGGASSRKTRGLSLRGFGRATCQLTRARRWPVQNRAEKDRVGRLRPAARPSGLRLGSGPAIGVRRKSGPLDAHHAEALAGRGLHDHPALQAARDFGAELLETRHFRGNVIGLDVQVDPARMIDKLDLHNGFIGRRLQHPVVAAAARMVEVHRAAQRTGPESGRCIRVRRVAVDQHGAQARVVHVGPPSFVPFMAGELRDVQAFRSDRAAAMWSAGRRRAGAPRGRDCLPSREEPRALRRPNRLPLSLTFPSCDPRTSQVKEAMVRRRSTSEVIEPRRVGR